MAIEKNFQMLQHEYFLHYFLPFLSFITLRAKSEEEIEHESTFTSIEPWKNCKTKVYSTSVEHAIQTIKNLTKNKFEDNLASLENVTSASKTIKFTFYDGLRKSHINLRHVITPRIQLTNYKQKRRTLIIIELTQFRNFSEPKQKNNSSRWRSEKRS